MKKTLSINQRLLIAASVVLVAFLSLTGIALDRAFRESALLAVQDRLQAQVYMLLGAANLNGENRLTVPDVLPEARLSTPGSGLYAAVVDMDDVVVWRSPSTLGLELAFSAVPEPGMTFFTRLDNADIGPLLALNFTVNWEIGAGEFRRYTFWVAESQNAYERQVASFARNLWLWLLAPLLGLLLVQSLILRWGLKPLRRVAGEIAAIEAGRQAELRGVYPKEMKPLTESLNQLIQQGYALLERHRNALGDLAHSLKTPLAVLRSALDNRTDEAHLRQTLAEQVERMVQTIDYQLQRAAASGRTALVQPLAVRVVAEKILASLAKVYADKKLVFELQAAPTLEFPCDQGDLMEVLGNLADNACKWARSRVTMRLRLLADDSGPRKGLVLEVEDDGPGIPPQQRRIILERGERADAEVAGQGIGLAVVRELVEEIYQGRLEIADGELGGTCVRVTLPA